MEEAKEACMAIGTREQECKGVAVELVPLPTGRCADIGVGLAESPERKEFKLP